MTTDFAVRAIGFVILLAFPALLLIQAFGYMTGIGIVLVPLILGLVFLHD
jgi:hypothetical protein